MIVIYILDFFFFTCATFPVRVLWVLGHQFENMACSLRKRIAKRRGKSKTKMDNLWLEIKFFALK